MFLRTLLKLFVLEMVLAEIDDPTANQLINFKENYPDPVGILTTDNGQPIGRSSANTIGSNLIRNNFFMDSIQHIVAERIPERVVHARGSGAFGYFEVTHDITDKCKAKLFETIGKKTPIAVRFSPSTVSRGGSETFRDTRGFAVKFYTEDGNFDILGLSQPILNINNAIWFPSLIHSGKANPATNVLDSTSSWDFIIGRNEALFVMILTSSYRGVPDGYRYMRGYSVHAYQVINSSNESYFMKFFFEPDLGERFLNASEAVRLAGTDPGYATRDLYNAIVRGDFPSWTVKAQILTIDEARNSKVNPFDVSKILSEDEFPLQPIGRLVLDKNPENFFADVEQLAFCPCNLVPGILGAPDKLFEARRMVYRDAQNYRLGINHNKIPVNCPYKTEVWTYNRDGLPPVGDNEGGTPNYLPNSFNGPIPIGPQQRLLKLRNDFTSNLDQVTEFYNSLTVDEQNDLVQQVTVSLCSVPEFLQEKVVTLLREVSTELSTQVALSIGNC